MKLFKKTLTQKLSVVMVLVLVLIFAVVTLTIGFASKDIVQDLAYAELGAIAKGNASEVQAIFDAADAAGQGVRDYLSRNYSRTAEEPAFAEDAAPAEDAEPATLAALLGADEPEADAALTEEPALAEDAAPAEDAEPTTLAALLEADEPEADAALTEEPALAEDAAPAEDAEPDALAASLGADGPESDAALTEEEAAAVLEELLAAAQESETAEELPEEQTAFAALAALLAAAEEEEDEPVSPLYGVAYNAHSYEMETYLMENCRSAVNGNPNIAASAVLFEPFAFDPNIEDFSVIARIDHNAGEAYSFGDYDEYSQNLFYSMAKQAGDVVVTQPYDFEGTKVVSVVYPVEENGEFKGVSVNAIDVTGFDLEKHDQYASMYSVIVAADGGIIYNSKDRAQIGSNIEQTLPAETYQDIMDKMTTKQSFYTTNVADGVEMTRFYAPIEAGNEIWWSVTVVETAEIMAPVHSLTILLIGLSLVAIVIMAVVIVLIVRKSLLPIQPVVKAAQEISAGNFHVQLNAASQDEIGMLAGAFSETANELRDVVADIKNVLSSLAAQDLRVCTSAKYPGELAEIETAMHKIINTLTKIIHGIVLAADQVSAGSEQVASGAQTLAQGASEQANSVQRLASTINTVSAQIQTMADNAKQASGQANVVGDEMQQSNHKMQELMGAMAQINNSSNEIQKIIKAIEDIAFQTNLLALNASVEAAHAGSAGKGFAVVADEVRNLASKSAEASKYTSTLIADSISAVENGTRLANETSQSLLIAVQGVSGVTEQIDLVSDNLVQQADAMLQVNAGIEQISSVVHANSATAEQSASASEEMSAQAQALKQLVGGFQLAEVKGKTNPAVMPSSAASGFALSDH